MYRYNQYDQQLVEERARQFRDQTERFLRGELPEEEFLNLRLRNGLYIQKHAPMLRIAIPYGMLRSDQMRKLADIADQFDKGYGHFTTRQNIQFNWPALPDVPDILDALASVQMHAIQTSGNCIRNTTSDEYAGVARDELEDPRPWCELIRQWSTFHPEFNWLPRKFKIAVTGASHDRAAVQVHDIGLRIVNNSSGDMGFEVLAGGGLGRTPVIGSVIRPFLPCEHLLTYLEAMLRVYNRYGRRDNKFKARIKILVRAMTPEVYAEHVEAQWQHLKDGDGTLTAKEIARVKSYFVDPAYEEIESNLLIASGSRSSEPTAVATIADESGFTTWLTRNVIPHKKTGYAIVVLSLKPTGVPPGDVTSEQMRMIADLADRYSMGHLRTTHEQNLVLADVRQDELRELWANATGLITPNVGLLTDMICCPGGDFCSLANAKSIPVAEAIQRLFDSTQELEDLGPLSINISGCMNACGHHHVGNIGILGVDKKGEEWYQISVGGSASNDASLSSILGPSFARAEVPMVIRRIIEVYKQNREPGETFIHAYRRLGPDPFKQRVYEKPAESRVG